MATEAQIDANRENAKAKSARNNHDADRLTAFETLNTALRSYEPLRNPPPGALTPTA